MYSWAFLGNLKLDIFPREGAYRSSSLQMPLYTFSPCFSPDWVHSYLGRSGRVAEAPKHGKSSAAGKCPHILPRPVWEGWRGSCNCRDSPSSCFKAWVSLALERSSSDPSKSCTGTSSGDLVILV